MEDSKDEYGDRGGTVRRAHRSPGCLLHSGGISRCIRKLKGKPDAYFSILTLPRDLY